jgi:2',3'-cyclic-nucleotide 2'-phosphodiesterase (5'-nucleotidase family)
MMHNGNSDNSKEGSEIVKAINQKYKNGVHLAASGHTHFIHNDSVDGVQVMQDGAENRNFGRVDLFFDFSTKEVLTQNTISKAGISIDHQNCNANAGDFCKEYSLPLSAKASIQSIIDTATNEIAPMAKQVLGEAKDNIGRNRINESALSNVLTDSLRISTNTEIAFMNTGGIRTDLKKGTILYEDLFEVLPFSNLGVVMNEVSWEVIKKVLIKSIQTCGKYGSLMQSGLKVQYMRKCTPNSDMDYSAKLVHVETLDGRLLLDQPSAFEINPTQNFSVATLDFLAAGGSGYQEFKEAKVSSILGIARELIVHSMAKQQPVIMNQLDGRFKNISP